MIRKVYSARSNMAEAMGKAPSPARPADASTLSLQRWAPRRGLCGCSLRCRPPQAAPRRASPSPPARRRCPPALWRRRARKRAVLDVASANHINRVWHMHRRINDSSQQAALRRQQQQQQQQQQRHGASGGGGDSAGAGGRPAARPASGGRPRNHKAELCNSLASWKPFSHRAGGGAQQQQEQERQRLRQQQYLQQQYLQQQYGYDDEEEDDEEYYGGAQAAAAARYGAEQRLPARWATTPPPASRDTACCRHKPLPVRGRCLQLQLQLQHLPQPHQATPPPTPRTPHTCRPSSAPAAHRSPAAGQQGLQPSYQGFPLRPQPSPSATAGLQPIALPISM